jgi:murein DD-endopeptidase MepM/ murein hydrolase activator NlpD
MLTPNLLPRLRSASRLRYAAHIVTAAIVIVVALSSYDRDQRGITQTGDVSQRSASRYQADPQVVRVVNVQARGMDSDTDVPDVQGARLVPQVAFPETYRLEEGETLGEIATRYSITIASLIWSNNLQNSDILAAGRQLRIPRVSGIPYTVIEGDTLATVAEKFNVSPDAITLFPQNALRSQDTLPVGREIFVPGGSLPYPSELLQRFGGEEGLATTRAVIAGGVREDETNLRSGPGRDYPRISALNTDQQLKLLARHQDWVKVEAGSVGIGWVRHDLLHISSAMFESLAETNDFPPPPPTWVWPAKGEITSLFGYRTRPFRSFHNGLDIANAARTKIYAARRGQVTEAGWCRGYGYCVKIDHGDGFSTTYGHLFSQPFVSAGDSVAAGELIGSMGSTFDRSGGGYSTGVHLHFTVYLNGTAVNPLKFLP